MDNTLKRLEGRLDELVGAYRAATERASALQARVDELEGRLAELDGSGERVAELERERGELAARLDKVLALVDDALAGGGSGA